MPEPVRAVGDQSGRSPRSSAYRVQVLDRTLRILDALAEADEGLGPAELARRLLLHKTTIHRLLRVLERHGLVRQDLRHGKYDLGVRLFELGSRAVARFHLREYAGPVLRRLVEQTRETAHVCILDDTEMVSIANVEGPWAMRSPSTVGRRSPVYCTSVGKAVIAFLPDDALDELIGRLTFKPFTPATLVTPTAFKAELMRVRQRGFATDDGEIEEGLRCVGAPIRNHAGRVFAAVSIAGPAFRLTDERLPAIAQAVLAAARDLSRETRYLGQRGVNGRHDARPANPASNSRHPAPLQGERPTSHQSATDLAHLDQRRPSHEIPDTPAPPQPHRAHQPPLTRQPGEPKRGTP